MASHEVMPLSDLRWWRGAMPIATPADLDPHARRWILGDSERLAIDRDGLRRRWGDNGFWLGTEPRYSFLSPDPGVPGARAWLAFGGRTIPLGMDPILGHLFGPGGRVLAFDGRKHAGPGDAPPLVRHSDLVAGAGRVQVVEVPAASVVMAFSGDGRTLACLALSDGGVRPLVYDLAGGWRASYPQLATALRFAPASEPERWILAELAVSRDGRLAAMAGDPARLRLFETRTGRSIWSLDAAVFGPDTFVVSVAFADDGSVVAVGDSAGVVRVLDVRDGRTLARFPWTLGRITTVGFHPDARTVAVVVHQEDAIRFWNWEPLAAPVRPDRLDHGDEVWALAFAHGGETLLSAGDDDRVRAWHLADGSSTEVDRGDALLSAAATGPMPGLLAVGSFDGTVRIRRVEGDGPGAAVLAALRGTRVRAVACHPLLPGLVVAGGTGPRVLVATPDGAGGYRERLVEVPHRDAYALAFSPDATTLAMGSHDKLITLWDAPGVRLRTTLETRAPVSCLAYSPDGRTLVSGDIEGGLQFWDMPAGTLRSTDFRASNTGGIWALAFSPDGKSLATGGDDRMVRVRDAATGQELLSLPGHDAKVHAVAFSPDGRVLASGDHNGAIRLWRSGP